MVREKENKKRIYDNFKKELVSLEDEQLNAIKDYKKALDEVEINKLKNN